MQPLFISLTRPALASGQSPFIGTLPPKAAAGASTFTVGPNGINHNGGPVMLGSVNVYHIFYGTWTTTQKIIISDLAKGLSVSYLFGGK